MAILTIIANLLIVLAYFFNPKLKEKREKEKILAIFKNLEEKLAKALIDKDMYLRDKIVHWMNEMRNKYDYLNR